MILKLHKIELLKNKILTLLVIIISFIILLSCFAIHKVRNVELRKELIDMANEDQKAMKESMVKNFSKARQNIGNNFKINNENKDPFQNNIKVWLDNTKRMKEIIKDFGWPAFDLVGKEASDSAWLLVQHGDLELQKMCIGLLKDAVDKHQANKWCYAYLLDRILIREGKKQLYGTQLDLKNGEVIPFPIDDEINLDKRRKEMGLEPFQVYIDGFQNDKDIIKVPFENK